MITPFKVLEEDIFPEVHSYVVHSLSSNGVSQSKIALKLGITQAMVSKYLAKEVRENDIVKDIAEKMVAVFDDSPEEVTKYIITVCFELMQSGKLCNLCAEKNGLKNCKACMNVMPDERKEIVDNIKLAVNLIEKENPIELVPNVMMNIAMRIRTAKTKVDVASIPGRIVRVNNKMKASNAPEFGTSNHLAKKLLENSKFRAIINIKYDKDMEKKIRQNKIDVIFDKGGFGIEPCIYVFGEDAVDVARKVVRLK